MSYQLNEHQFIIIALYAHAQAYDNFSTICCKSAYYFVEGKWNAYDKCSYKCVCASKFLVLAKFVSV